MKKKIMGLLLTVTIILTGCGHKAEATDQTVSGQESNKIIEETRETGSEEDSTEETQKSTKPLETEPMKSDEGTENSSEPAGQIEVKGSSQAPSNTAAKNTSVSKSSQESKSKTENSQTGSKPSTENSQAGSKPSTESGTGSTKPSAGSDTGNAGTGNGGTTSTPKPSHTTCTWNGGKVTIAASCNSDGVKTYTCTVCGVTRTEGIAKTAHSYISETTPPTCTEAGKIKTTCSVCGSVQSESAGAAATGHKMIDSWFGEPPTCSKGGYLNRYCTVCDFLETSTSMPPLEHNLVLTNTQLGNCMADTIKEFTCSACGEVKHERESGPQDHSWVSGDLDGWGEVVEYCERCTTRK